MKVFNGENPKSEDTTIISNGVIIEGTLRTNGNIRVDGEMKGDIICENHATVGDTGKVNGQIKAEIITIGGNVTGSLIAKDRLYLKSRGILNGDMYMKLLIVEEGAKFNGKCSMNELPQTAMIKEEQKEPAEKKQ